MTDNIQLLKNFNEESNINNFSQLPEWLKEKLYLKSIYCLRTGDCDKDIANKIKLFYITKDFDDDSKRDLKSLFLALKILIIQKYLTQS